MAYAASTLCQRFHILPNIFRSPIDMSAIIRVLLRSKPNSDFNLIHVCTVPYRPPPSASCDQLYISKCCAFRYFLSPFCNH